MTVSAPTIQRDGDTWHLLFGADGIAMGMEKLVERRTSSARLSPLRARWLAVWWAR